MTPRDRDRLAATLARLLAAAWKRHAATHGAALVDQTRTAAGNEEVRDDADVSKSSA